MNAERKREKVQRERQREKRDFWREKNASLCITLDIQYT